MLKCLRKDCSLEVAGFVPELVGAIQGQSGSEFFVLCACLRSHVCYLSVPCMIGLNIHLESPSLILTQGGDIVVLGIHFLGLMPIKWEVGLSRLFSSWDGRPLERYFHMTFTV